MSCSGKAESYAGAGRWLPFLASPGAVSRACDAPSLVAQPDPGRAGADATAGGEASASPSGGSGEAVPARPPSVTHTCPVCLLRAPAMAADITAGGRAFLSPACLPPNDPQVTSVQGAGAEGLQRPGRVCFTSLCHTQHGPETGRSVQMWRNGVKRQNAVTVVKLLNS